MKFRGNISIADCQEYAFITAIKTKLGKKTYQRMTTGFLIFFSVLLVLYIGMGILIKIGVAWLAGFIICILAVFALASLRYSLANLDKRYGVMGGGQYEVTFNENGVNSRNLTDDGNTFMPWSNVVNCIKTDTLYILVSNKGIGIFFNKDAVLGWEQEVEQFIEGYTGLKIIYRKS